jgi:hypothetical protein
MSCRWLGSVRGPRCCGGDNGLFGRQAFRAAPGLVYASPSSGGCDVAEASANEAVLPKKALVQTFIATDFASAITLEGHAKPIEVSAASGRCRCLVERRQRLAVEASRQCDSVGRSCGAGAAGLPFGGRLAAHFGPIRRSAERRPVSVRCSAGSCCTVWRSCFLISGRAKKAGERSVRDVVVARERPQRLAGGPASE